MDGRVITQTAPYPDQLAAIVAAARYKPGWTFTLVDAQFNDWSGLTLVIQTVEPDALAPDRTTPIAFPFSVPAEVHDEAGWQAWLFDRIGDAERHERGEWFRVGDSRPYAPQHVPVADGYRAERTQHP
ncbi:hypothetical protein SEA_SHEDLOCKHOLMES_30 [Mycobacterium phage ShedlockHolmes]|uniref:Uncharacterized protein n=1 Tax=Mycobacterium phage ShedlockHolmes TaxID=1647313 RepID=A0A0F6SK21_9CAUD|nr:hypothetical protein SEA_SHEDLOCKHOLMES_30 [Mycobacterium phage ShedlockHolmes]AKF15207.1 hypothetical protein SEA_SHEDLOCKHOLMES_30 [Mycobacterium phage ShedlockHolmes]